LTRLIVGAPVYFVPAWMPNGRQVVFTANRTGAYNLYIRNADGSGTERRLTTSTQTQVPNSILPDDSFLLGAQLNPKTGWDIIKVPLSGTGTEALVTTPEAEYAANISPNGRFFAYESFETGRSEILIRPYPDAGRQRWQISTGGGLAPIWSRTGRELFFLDGDSHTLMSVDVETSVSEFTAGKPKPVLRTAYFGVFYAYDVSPDGQRFLFIKEAAATNTIEIVVNWVEELRARLLAKQ
jgi:serine/threonine-protein kinase